MKNKLFSLVLIAIIILLSFNELIYSQAGTYYDALNTGSSSFINDLETRIRSPYTRITYDNYDETNIANFASFDNGDGTRSVFCVYSHYEYIYSGTFAWTTMSREHTYCQSWMPSTPPITSLPEYSDQYHIFPVNQDNSNGIRNNHPLGIVSTITSTFLEAKYGKDSNGNNVYEPRDEHKGDAARALLYMVVRYNGINGYDWTFNWLNGTRLPSLSEGSQDLATLLAWNKQDPPDKWEVDRSNYIQSIQENRNPFVDHPEYVNYIDFNDLSKLSPTYDPEPTNYVSNFSSSASASSITFSWTDATAGSQSPSGYLLLVYNKDNYFLPIDGETYSNDTDISDGKAVINITYADADSYELTGLSNNTVYYGTIYSYNGSGTLRNYKIDGTLPRTSVSFNVSLAAEPTNHITNFASGTITSSSIQVTWTQAIAGTQAPAGYLLLANLTGTFSDPVGGIVNTTDTALGDGSASVYILYSAANNYTFYNLHGGTTYYFKIFPYNGTSIQTSYKTNGVVPTLNVQTNAGDNVWINEIDADQTSTDTNEFIELAGIANLNITGYQIVFYNGGTTGTNDYLTQTIGSFTFSNELNGYGFYVAGSSNVTQRDEVLGGGVSNLIQNGSPDGVALFDDSKNLIFAYSYGGTFTGSKTGYPDVPFSTSRSGVDGTTTSMGFLANSKPGDTDLGVSNLTPTPGSANTDGVTTQILPVELTSFTGYLTNNSVVLKWQTMTEVNNYGFEVERKIPDQVRNDNADWVKVGFVAGAGNSNSPKSYIFTDQPSGGKSFSYRLKQLDNDGKYRYYDAITVLLVTSNKAQLMQNNPNPFNPSTVIKFYLPNESNVKIQIFDLLGKEINVLLDSKNDAGYHLVYWNGRDKYGKQAASGVYFYRLTAGNFIETKKMLMMK